MYGVFLSIVMAGGNTLAEPVVLKRDMALTQDEFYRLIKKTVADESTLTVDAINATVRFPFSNGEIIISLGAQETRKIASLAIKHILIHFTFQSLSADEIKSYLYKFDTTFQKGGG